LEAYGLDHSCIGLEVSPSEVPRDCTTRLADYVSLPLARHKNHLGISELRAIARLSAEPKFPGTLATFVEISNHVFVSLCSPLVITM
jgi:hypothetical protein